MGSMVVLAGAVGAAVRFSITSRAPIHTRGIPLGTLAVNLGGSFLLGVVAAGGQPHALATTLATGFLGGFTTFSTWMIETLGGETRQAVANLVVMSVGGVVAAAVGWSIAS